jgi:hypothetical protein
MIIVQLVDVGRTTATDQMQVAVGEEIITIIAILKSDSSYQNTVQIRCFLFYHVFIFIRFKSSLKYLT